MTTFEPALSSPSPLRTLAVTILLLLGIAWKLFGSLLWRSSNIPGPKWARLSPLWLAYHARRGQRSLMVHKAHQQYGSVVRIAPNHVSLSSKDVIRTVYAHGHHSLDKTSFYTSFVSEKPSVFSTTDRAEHARKRRIVAQPFSLSAMEGFCPFIEVHLENMVEILSEYADSGNTTDLLTWINYLTFDVLSDLAFGEAIGMLKKRTDLVDVIHQNGSRGQQHAIELVDGREHLSAVLGLIPPYLRGFARFLPDSFFQRAQRCSDGLCDFAREKVTNRLYSHTQRDDILGKLLVAYEKQGIDVRGEGIHELVGECATLLTAGSDTTATTSCAIIHFVMSHRHVYERLVDELDAHLSTHELPSYRDVKSMPYLQAVITEGMRLHATMALGLPRYAPEGGMVVDGFFIPPGTEVSVPPFTVQRTVFDDGESFIPERWLEPKAYEMKQYVLTFGRGPRSCLGKHLAETEMLLIVATILSRFKPHLVSDRLHTTEGFVHKVVQLPVRLAKRCGE